jgi:hypothetical protein
MARPLYEVGRDRATKLRPNALQIKNKNDGRDRDRVHLFVFSDPVYSPS